MKTIKIAACLAALSVTSCQVWNMVFAPPALREAFFSPSVPIRFIRQDGSLVEGNQSEQVVFRTQAEVDAFLKRRPLTLFGGNGGRVAALPPVDFTKEMGILVIGAQNPNVTSLEIASVEEQGDRLYVRAVQWLPDPRGIRLPAFSQPSHYVAVARTDKPVVFAPIVEAYGNQRPVPYGPPRSPEPFPSVFLSPPPIIGGNQGHVSTLEVDAKNVVDITTDGFGNLYLAGEDSIRKVSPKGQVMELAVVRNPLTTPGLDVTKTIAAPRSIAADNRGTLYISSEGRTYKFEQNGSLMTLPGLEGEAAVGLVVKESVGVFMASANQDLIYSLSSNLLGVFIGRNRRNRVTSGPVGSGYRDGDIDEALFRMPTDLAVDKFGNLIVADSNNGAIRKIDRKGSVNTIVGNGKDFVSSPNPSPDLPVPPQGIPVVAVAVDFKDRIYAACSDNRIRLVQPDGTVSVLAGDGTSCPAPLPQASNAPGAPLASLSTQDCYKDGQGTNARFDHPLAIAVDNEGVVYVLEGSTLGSRRIRKIE